MPQTPIPNLIEKLASSIATAEGFFIHNSVPSRDNNPGDERAAPWLDGSASHAGADGFVHFAQVGLGIAGLYHQIALNIARGYSLRKLIFTWAPPSDGNNSENYLTETARRIGMEPSQFDTPLYIFLGVSLIP